MTTLDGLTAAYQQDTYNFSREFPERVTAQAQEQKKRQLPGWVVL